MGDARGDVQAQRGIQKGLNMSYKRAGRSQHLPSVARAVIRSILRDVVQRRDSRLSVSDFRNPYQTSKPSRGESMEEKLQQCNGE